MQTHPTPDRDAEARDLAEQVAALLTRLQALGPVAPANGSLLVLGAVIRPDGNGSWSVRPN
ncbi:hypothetical protein [Streptomyces sp. NPDC056491]|uniref:hypothetical protein n=1 Tax=Streptomyces sp. NPDC056491 TaxID=3345837 RepID=UPI0036D014A0